MDNGEEKRVRITYSRISLQRCAKIFRKAEINGKVEKDSEKNNLIEMIGIFGILFCLYIGILLEGQRYS